ncbi:MAG: mandelate racemase/muconate lactonizing enzyme family protein [Bryobacteraceae bacterium]|nr:mandelate racemase/muconate lactonizing enzyme family protein [Bryobacteraceae bacterium]MDW8378006.1 mandelate racemase/muconate lactonizing enzyme family protein [Bryobacterales bacterium]
MRRRDFFATASFSALGLAQPKDYATSTAPGAAPDWEAPLFDLFRHSKSPVVAHRLELLKAGSRYFLRATSKDGVTGVALVKQIDEYLTMLTRLAMPFFQGKDARALETLIDEYYVKHYKLAGQALWAPAAYVEQALLDLYGKTVQKSVAELLGGVRRTQIPVYLSGSVRETTAEQEVEVYAQALQQSGAKAVKFKIAQRMGRNADVYPGRTERMLQLARKTFGDHITIYVDANGGYNAAKAISLGPLFRELKIAFFEEPCPWEEISETKRVADSLEIPIAFGECDSSLWKFDYMIRTRALDIVQPDLNYNGGFLRTARVARMAAKAGIPITPHNTQTGAAACNLVQFACATRNIGPYMELPFRGKYAEEPWASVSFRIKNGAIGMPEGPGLGVTVDPAYLAKAQLIAAV